MLRKDPGGRSRLGLSAPSVLRGWSPHWSPHASGCFLPARDQGTASPLPRGLCQRAEHEDIGAPAQGDTLAEGSASPCGDRPVALPGAPLPPPRVTSDRSFRNQARPPSSPPHQTRLHGLLCLISGPLKAGMEMFLSALPAPSRQTPSAERCGIKEASRAA